MTSFRYLPHSDIAIYITANGINTSSNIEDDYINAYKLASLGIVEGIPETVEDFIIAYNISQQEDVREKLKVYNNYKQYEVSDIIFSSNDYLIKLAYILGFNYVNKTRMIRVLSYLGFINNNLRVYDMLPDAIVEHNIEQLSCDDIYTVCSLSENLNKFCTNNLDVIRRKIHEITGLDTTDMQGEELQTLCKIHM